MHICICIKSLPGGAPTEYQRLLTRPFYQHANEIYARFEDWKDINRFYFISLFLEMTYSNNGIVSELAPDPVAGGPSYRTPSTIRGCPSVARWCPFRYVDSPLSGCLGLEGYCDCGWSGFETISGWFKRGVAMREQLTDDKIRHSKYNLFHINAELATLDELSTWLTL